MRELALNFEHYVTFLDHSMLLSVGIIAAATGLVMWLAGMALRKFFLFVVCAAAGAIVGSYFVGKKTISAVGLASLFGIVAVYLNRFFITILAAALAVSIAMVALAWHYDGMVLTELPIETLSVTLNGNQTMEFTCRTLSNLASRVDEVCRLMPAFNWLLFPVLVVIFIAGGLFFWNIICAWLWATAGTILIFAGMISLLLHKGSHPIACIFRNDLYYIVVFTAMIIIGAIVQLLLFHNINTEPLRKKIKSDASHETSKKQGWRGL